MLALQSKHVGKRGPWCILAYAPQGLHEFNSYLTEADHPAMFDAVSII